MTKRTRFIQHNKTQVVDTNEDTSNQSPFLRWAEQGKHIPSTANPDILEDSDANKIWGNGTKPELATLIIERFADSTGYFPVLTAKQNQILRLYVNGMTVTEISKQMKLDKRRVSSYLKRIGCRFKRLLKSVDF